MTLSTKRNVVFAVVAALAIWPALHPLFVRALDLSPWNWFGWAMYTQPAERIRVSYFSLAGEQLSYDMLDERELEALKRSYQPWSLRYIQVHDFDPPDEVAAVLLRAMEDWRGVRIRVERIGLDRESATVSVLRAKEYSYRRR